LNNINNKFFNKFFIAGLYMWYGIMVHTPLFGFSVGQFGVLRLETLEALGMGICSRYLM